LLEYDTAGDPITGLRWSRRTTAKVALALGDFGISVSPNTVARLLHQMGYSLRVNHKKLSTDHSPDRNDQFLYLTIFGSASSVVAIPLSASIPRSVS
jgi:Rhodopirellula transposase DDE domain